MTSRRTPVNAASKLAEVGRDPVDNEDEDDEDDEDEDEDEEAVVAGTAHVDDEVDSVEALVGRDDAAGVDTWGDNMVVGVDKRREDFSSRRFGTSKLLPLVEVASTGMAVESASGRGCDVGGDG